MRARREQFRCELHMHTSYSDGYRTPEYMLGGAVAKGLSVVAITDHDNAEGVRGVVAVAPHFRLELIPAIEFTARWDNALGGCTQDVDVLGYYVDLDNPALRKREQASLADLDTRIAGCCAHLSRAGYAIRFIDLVAKHPDYVGLRQVRDELIDRGYFETEDDANEVLSEAWAQVRLCEFTLQDQIRVIHAAGGVAILAHPGFIQCEGRLIQAEDIAELMSMGLDGLEVYHRSMDTEMREHFRTLAAQFDLLVTGGSDEHGWSASLEFMGQEPVTRSMVDALRERHLSRIGVG